MWPKERAHFGHKAKQTEGAIQDGQVILALLSDTLLTLFKRLDFR